MLHVFFGNMPDAVYNTAVYFKNTYEDDWLTDDFAKKIIKSIDKSTVLSAHAIDSPVLGVIPPTQLAGGTKTLLLIKNCPDMIFNASTCGDNCARFLLELGKQSDITVNLRHLMNFGRRKFTIHVINDDVTVHCMEELLPIAAKYV